MSELSSNDPSAPPQNPQAEQRKDKEECISRYKAGGFHPVRVNEVYNHTYIVISKLGWGRYSTVWLVQDIYTAAEKVYAMKVLSAECCGADSGIFELEILQHLREGDVEHPGYQHISILYDWFTHKGPNGDHVCLIFKVMGESLSTFRKRFSERKIPTPLLQRFTKQLLQALRYAHERGVIHTDIQPSNIMIQIPNEHLLTATSLSLSLPETYPSNASQSRKYEIVPTHSLREIYLSESFNLAHLNIALSDWGVASFTTRHLTSQIQHPLLCAPEVLLDAPWDAKVDIWNLGTLVPELVFRHRMFCARDKPGGRYNVGRHLEEVVGLCGPFPKSLLEKGDEQVVKEVFDAGGNLKINKLNTIPGLEQSCASMDSKERSKFVAFITRMLVLDPEKRPGAKKLLEDEWLKHNYDEDVSEEQ